MRKEIIVTYQSGAKETFSVDSFSLNDNTLALWDVDGRYGNHVTIPLASILKFEQKP